MIASLIQGTLFRAPEQRTAKSGKPFTTATVRIKDGEGSQFVRIAAFSEHVQSELLRLSNGEHRVSLSLVADQVLPLRRPSKERKPKEPAQDNPHAARAVCRRMDGGGRAFGCNTVLRGRAVILGIDIGTQGALALLTPDGDLIEIADMPVPRDGPKGRATVNAPLLAVVLFKCHAARAFIEHVSARPGEGAIGAFAFGRSPRRCRRRLCRRWASCGLPHASLLEAGSRLNAGIKRRRSFRSNPKMAKSCPAIRAS